MASPDHYSPILSCGRDFSFVADIKSTLDSAMANGFNFICLPISHPRLKREFLSGPCKDRADPFAKSDLVLTSSEWSNKVVVKCKVDLDCDSVNEHVRRQSEQTLLQELSYASHLSVMAVQIRLTRPENVNLANIVNRKSYKESMNCPVWVQVPMICPSTQASRYRRNSSVQTAKPDTWEWWNQFRSLCSHNKNICLALEVTSDLPSNEEVARWLGEPVKCIVISTNIFFSHEEGFPVLSKAHQLVLQGFLALSVNVAISGTHKHESIELYLRHINHINQTLVLDDPLLSYGQGYEDLLQVPLQPLMNNLDSQTYEVFEKDLVRYSEYERAILYALLDRVSTEQKDPVSQVVMVVGAGRGRLVTATINAAHRADCKVTIYAVEKNPYAVLTLLDLKDRIWRDSVTVVSCDMRDWDAPEKADILVSELLGSFGDNELSPECLDGAQKFLKDDGISIPSSYTSYLAPVHNPRLYGEVAARFKDSTHVFKSLNFEMPYVVHQQILYPLAPTQPLFMFHHPNKDAAIGNFRYKSLKFKVNNKGLLHGFNGYFEAVLYKDVMLSIVPTTYTEEMVSCFAMFFPIKEPVPLKAGDEVVVHFWRVHNRTDVWYEWTLSSPVTIPIHNPSGRAFKIGLLT